MRKHLLPALVCTTMGVMYPATPAVHGQGTRVDFARDVQPLLRQHCTDCHGGDQPRGSYRLDRRSGALGVVVTEVGFKLASDPDTVRAPDVAFVRQDRIRASDPRGFWHGPPDLAVEVLSPDDRLTEVRAKVDEYLSCGTPVVLVIDPDEETVTAFRRLAPPIVLEAIDDVLEVGEVLPGFRCTLREIFR
jgi:Putative restriction endonuclease/Planctomycete cytochrome C